MVRAGNLPDRSVRESAITAYRASTIVSRDVNAPPGAFHWWDIGQYGHVAMATDRGWALMASRNVRESWGDASLQLSQPISSVFSAAFLKYSCAWSIACRRSVASILSDILIVYVPSVDAVESTSCRG